MKYGIMIQDSGQYLSKTNLFTTLKGQVFKTGKVHAEWLLEQFKRERVYLVEIVEFR